MSKIITICGSMRFKNIMIDCYNELTSKGYLVFLPFFGEVTNENMETIHEVHYEKIRMSDYVVIVDSNKGIGHLSKYLSPDSEWKQVENGCSVTLKYKPYIDTPYIGDDTNREIEFAKSIEKEIRYLSKDSLII